MNTDCGYPNREIARSFEKARELRAAYLRALVPRTWQAMVSVCTRALSLAHARRAAEADGRIMMRLQSKL